MNSEHSEASPSVCLCLCCAVCAPTAGTVRVTRPSQRPRHCSDSRTWAVFPSTINFSTICQSPRNMLHALTSYSFHTGLLWSRCEEKEGFNNCRRQWATVGAKSWSERREGSPKLASWGAVGLCTYSVSHVIVSHLVLNMFTVYQLAKTV